MTTNSIPTIEAIWLPSDLAVDDLQSPHWQTAVPVEIKRRWSGEAATPNQYAEARILWNDHALSVRFIGRQMETPIVNPKPKLDRKTIGLWNRDVCEIFIAPVSDVPSRYFEFEAAPTGEWIDLGISFEGSKRETDFGYHSGMTVAATVVEETLTLAMRIPWSNSIPKPEPRETWRVNLFRCIGKGHERYVAWQPSFTPEPNFHVPEVFGWLKFA